MMIDRRHSNIRDRRERREMVGRQDWQADIAEKSITNNATPIPAIEDAVSSREKLERLHGMLVNMGQLTASFEQAPVGIALLDLEGRWLRINRKLCNIVGYSMEELLERRLTDVTYPDDLQIDLAQNKRMLAGEIQTYSLDQRYLHKNGGAVWLNVCVALVRKPDATPDYFISVVEEIDVRKQDETALRVSEEQLQILIAQAPVALAMFDREMCYLHASHQWLEDYNRDLHEVRGRSHYDISPEISERWKAVHRRGMAGEVVRAEEDLFERADGSVQWLHWEVRPWYDAADQVGGIIIFAEDITKRKPDLEALRIAGAAFKSHAAMVITDANTVILQVNKGFSDLTGYANADVVGKTPRMFKSGHHGKAFYAAMWDTIKRSGSWTGELWDRRKNGEIYIALVTITAVKNQDDVVTHYVSTQTDITARKAAEDEINRLAFFDILTGLPNRRLLIDRLRQILATGIRTGHNGALMFIDLDKFKTLNDTLGHDKGDCLLQQVAERLSSCVREGDTVARLGGDEFMVVLDGLKGNPDDASFQAESAGEKILAALNQAYDLMGHTYCCTASIGVTLLTDQTHGIEELLKRADMAMYQAKAAGSNTIRFFDSKIQDVITAHAVLDAEFRQGLLQKEFVLHYQAQVDRDRKLTGVEALIRWQHPQRGLVAPAEFIPIAEENGLISPLGQWILEAVCTQLAAWATRPELAHLTIAVNVSAQQFSKADFVDQVLALLNTTGANPQRLKLELTESLLISNVKNVIDKMLALKAKGVSFALDDFGTGYSSLSYLKRLPLDQLKIDRSFVLDVLSDPDDVAIIKTILALGNSLGLGVIAEGVETDAQREFLANSGCHAYQGYFFCRPLPIAEFEQFALG